MAKQGGKVLSFVAWLTGVLVSLSVGFAMAGFGVEQTLSLPRWLGGDTMAMIVGWVVVITTLISAVMAIMKE